MYFKYVKFYLVLILTCLIVVNCKKKKKTVSITNPLDQDYYCRVGINVPHFNLTYDDDPNDIKLNPGIIIRFNNDNDNGERFTATDPSIDARECEIIPDYKYVQNTVIEEDDLIEVNLFANNKIPDDGEIKIKLTNSSGGNIRIWNNKNKGSISDILMDGLGEYSYLKNNLPNEIYIEGTSTGRVLFELSHNYDVDGVSYVAKDLIRINIFDLTCQSMTEIWDYNIENWFQVKGSTSPPPGYGGKWFTFEWDLDGNGIFNDVKAETAQKDNNLLGIIYGDTENNNSIKLDQIEENQKKIYNISVNAGLVNGTFVKLEKRIRVNIGKFFGNQLTGTTDIERQSFLENIVTSFSSEINLPTPLQNTPDGTGVLSQDWYNIQYGLTKEINAGNRIQYAPLLSTSFAEVMRSSEDPGSVMFHCICVSNLLWNSIEPKPKDRDLAAILVHEAQHMKQNWSVWKNNPVNNVWYLLDLNLDNAIQKLYLMDFQEADACFKQITSDLVSWQHLYAWGTNINALSRFESDYNAAVARLDNDLISDSTTKDAARELLQEIYTSLPSEINDISIRPPL